MPRKRKRVDSYNRVSDQLDINTRNGVEQSFNKKFTYSPVHYRPFIPQLSKSQYSGHAHSSESYRDHGSVGGRTSSSEGEDSKFNHTKATGPARSKINPIKELQAPKSIVKEGSNVCEAHSEQSSGHGSSACVEMGEAVCARGGHVLEGEDRMGAEEVQVVSTDVNGRIGLEPSLQVEAEKACDFQPVELDSKECPVAEAEVQSHKGMETEVEENLVEDVWQDSQLQQLKTDLNLLKDQLSDKDVIEWHKHTSFTNMAGNIVDKLKKVFHVELCTQAWSKFFEVLSTYPILPLQEDAIGTVHLCEAPGAFITALNHFLVLQAYSGQWQWVGATLSPYYEGNDLVQMVDDDRFIRSTLDNWYFGEDGTGNIMDWANVQGLMERTAQMGRVQLVTADGSIDCQNTPSEQEVVVSHLHYCEVLTAIHILSPGGAFVLKLFTMFESSTVALMYLLCTQFEEVHIYKPITSKGGNSEVYAVCCGFRNQMEKELLMELSTHFFSDDVRSDVPIFHRRDIPESFIEEHVKCCKYFVGCQSDTIQTNLLLYENFPETHRAHMEVVKDHCMEVFISRYTMRTMPAYHKITAQCHRKGTASPFETTACSPQSKVKQTHHFDKPFTQRIHTGSFKFRMEANNLPWKQRILLMEKLDIVEDRFCLMCNDLLHPAEINHWTVKKGRPLHYIKCSRFCDSKYVKKFNTLLEHAKITSYMNESSVHVCEEVTNVILNAIKSLTPTVCQVLILDAEPKLRELLLSALPLESVCQEIQTSQEAVVVLSVTDSGLEPGTEELGSRKKMLSNLIQFLKILPEGGHLLLHLYTSLTFFTAGLLYVLSRMFSKVSQCPHLPGVSFQQVLCFEGFGDLHPSILTYLEQLEEEVARTTTDVLEIMPKSVLINDTTFTRFAVNINRQLVGQFVNTVIDLETSNLTENRPESSATSGGS